MPAFAKLLRACRARTAYAKGHSWAVGLIRDETCANYPFKPGYVDEKLSPEMDRAANAWGGDIESWDYALAHAAVGKTMDFYVSSVGGVSQGPPQVRRVWRAHQGARVSDGAQSRLEAGAEERSLLGTGAHEARR